MPQASRTLIFGDGNRTLCFYSFYPHADLSLSHGMYKWWVVKKERKAFFSQEVGDFELIFCFICIAFLPFLNILWTLPLDSNRFVMRGFPGGSAVKNSAAEAGDTSLISDAGRSHMPRSSWAHVPPLLRPRAATAEARGPGTGAPQQEKPPQGGGRALQLESSPHLPQLEKSHTAMKT